MKGLRLVSAGMVIAITFMTGVFGTPGVHAKPSAAAQHPFYDIAQITPGAPLNFFNTKGMGGQWGPDVTIAPLADWKFGANPVSPKSFFAGLAKSWKVSRDGKTVTMYLNPKARWSNGKPVTARDVYVSTQIGFAEQAIQATGLGSYRIVNSRQIVFHQLPDNHYNLFLFGLFINLVIAPASQYGKLLPSNISSILSASQYAGTDPALQKKAQDAVTQLEAVKNKIEAYEPRQNLSDGPYKIDRVSPAEISLTKNKYFYDAKRIRINRLILRNYNDNQQIWNFLLGGQVYQATSGGMTSDLVNNIKHAAGGHNKEYRVPSTASLQMVFNENVYPYNMVKVRQALAYLINRKTIQKVAAPVGGTASKWLGATVDANINAYLTKAQLKKLNPYNPNRKKAISLLKSAGFKQTGGKWMMPNGKPWTITMWTVAGFNDVIEGFQTIANTLNSFGVPTQVQLVSSYGQYLLDIKTGKYGVMFWIGTGALPYSMMARLFMTPNGYQVEGGKLVHYPPSQKDKGNWLDFPTSVKVKGYGTVKVGPLVYSLSQTRDPKKIKRIEQELMITANQYVPEITMWNVTQVGFVNDRYFTRYPTKNIQIMRTCGYYPPIACWQMRGYVRPR